MPENATLKQKKIEFAQSAVIEGAIAILRDCTKNSQSLVGDTEYATLVNAITMDAQASMIINFIDSIERIKRGELLTTES